jgi:hypothetical protein
MRVGTFITRGAAQNYGVANGHLWRLAAHFEGKLLVNSEPIKMYPCAGQIRCKRLFKSNANSWSNQCNGNYLWLAFWTVLIAVVPI